MDAERRKLGSDAAGDEQGDEVEGHVVRPRIGPGTDGPQAEVEGHMVRPGRATDQPADADTEQGDDPDVEGHMDPYLAEKVGRARLQDFLDEADRDRRGMLARPNERDGGILNKMRRRKER